MEGVSPDEELRHDVRGGGGEEDAVAVVAGGDEVVGSGGESAEEGKAVGSCGAKACPGFELRRVGERREAVRAARERRWAMSEGWTVLSKPASSMVAPMMARPALGPEVRGTI